jgi:hypothetical protein
MLNDFTSVLSFRHDHSCSAYPAPTLKSKGIKPVGVELCLPIAFFIRANQKEKIMTAYISELNSLLFLYTGLLSQLL